MRRTAGLVAGLVAVTVTGVTVATLVMAPDVPRGAPPSSVPVAAPSANPPPAPSAGPAETAEAAEETPAATARPVRLRIPSIGLTAPIIGLGLNPDRTVEVPSNPDETGWYRPGPVPGDDGSAVILGHVDSVEGPAVFHRLRELQPGDTIAVDAADGSTTEFRVLRLATYANESFPADQVYAAPGPGRLLNLVTCGGVFDPEDGYQANLVVYTRQAV